MRLMPFLGRLIGLALAAVGSASAERATAQEYCVACTEPTAVYRCIVEGARPGGSQPLQMLCVTAMAREGQHGTCGVKGGTVFDCNGPVKRIPWAAQNVPALAPSDKEAAKPPPQPASQDANQPPQTVQEMARRANEKTAEQAKALGQTVGDATKKTWRCITSFFTRCTQ